MEALQTDITRAGEARSKQTNALAWPFGTRDDSHQWGPQTRTYGEDGGQMRQMQVHKPYAERMAIIGAYARANLKLLGD